jgi:hypothetical protein
MSKQTHTVDTAYGQTTIETYECDSCGTKVRYDETVEFTIGEREGRACNHCEANGPISVPKKVARISLPSSLSLFFIAGFPILGPLTALIAFVDGDDFARAFTLGWTTLLLWGFLLLATSIFVL